MRATVQPFTCRAGVLRRISRLEGALLASQCSTAAELDSHKATHSRPARTTAAMKREHSNMRLAHQRFRNHTERADYRRKAVVKGRLAKLEEKVAKQQQKAAQARKQRRAFKKQLKQVTRRQNALDEYVAEVRQDILLKVGKDLQKATNNHESELAALKQTQRSELEAQAGEFANLRTKYAAREDLLGSKIKNLQTQWELKTQLSAEDNAAVVAKLRYAYLHELSSSHLPAWLITVDCQHQVIALAASPHVASRHVLCKKWQFVPQSVFVAALAGNMMSCHKAATAKIAFMAAFSA